VFVQIGDENMHLVRALMDEVFGSENFASVITFKTTTGAGSFAGGTNVLASVCDYVVWYARDLERVKYRQIFRTKEVGGLGGTQYRWIENDDGTRERLSLSDAAERLVNGARIFSTDNLTSQTTRVGQTTVFPVQVDGKSFKPGTGGWKTNREGMQRLLNARRVQGVGNTLTYVRYFRTSQPFL